MKKKGVKIKVSRGGDKNGFIKVLLILFFVFVIWAVVAVNGDKVSNFWVKNSDGNSITGNAVLTCTWNGKAYPSGLLFYDSETIDPYTGCRLCTPSLQKLQRPLCS
ncbi:MAG: hypothetical protein AABY22_25265, partial [Nanoarchaeota archaeon]